MEKISPSLESTKDSQWNTALEHVRSIDNGGVEQGIVETVAALSVHGFTTTQSCEGHMDGNVESHSGYPYPWIEIGSPRFLATRDDTTSVYRRVSDAAVKTAYETIFPTYGYEEESWPTEAHLAWNSAYEKAIANNPLGVEYYRLKAEFDAEFEAEIAKMEILMQSYTTTNPNRTFQYAVDRNSLVPTVVKELTDADPSYETHSAFLKGMTDAQRATFLEMARDEMRHITEWLKQEFYKK